MLSIIVAVANDNAIGSRGDLAFHISADLRRFKQLTMGCPVLMGRKTFESLPKGALPGRRNIVVTNNRQWHAENVETVHSLEEGIALAGDGAFIIGGGRIYEQALGLCDVLHITRIYADAVDADTFFPEYESGWRPVEVQQPMVDPATGLEYQFMTYKRK